MVHELSQTASAFHTVCHSERAPPSRNLLSCAADVLLANSKFLPFDFAQGREDKVAEESE